MYFAAEGPPAGGAALDEILIAAGIFIVAYLPLAWFLYRERTGHRTVIGRVADWISRKDGMPRWAGLPMYLTVISLLTAGFGVYWDVPIHMQYGRDEGPLANPSHYPILFGILGFLAAGVICAGLAKDPLPRRTVRFAKDWHVPMGAMILLGAGLIAAAGFPADDLWHRLFGQDVTEWGPTHVMMIGGAVTCILAVPLLLAEATQVGRAPGRPSFHRFIGRIVMACLRVSGKLLPPVKWEMERIGGDHRAWSMRFLRTVVIGMCIIPVAFLMEFDLGVPQFPVATLLIIGGFLTAWIFVAGRLTFGPGGALVAWGTYEILRLLIALMSVPTPDHIHVARWSLFLGCALAIELVALVWKHRGPLFAVVAGGLAGSVGQLPEFWWMKVFMPIPLPPAAEHYPWLLAVGGVAGIGGALTGLAWSRWLAKIVDPDAEPAGRTGADPSTSYKQVGTLGVVTFLVLMGVFAPPTSQGDVEVVKECDDELCITSYEPVEGTDVWFGEVSYDEACIGEDGCLSNVTVRVTPTDAVDGAVWISSIAYQGYFENDPTYPTGQVTIDLESTGVAGVYRTTDPLPLYGQWKTFLRLHKAPTMMSALPLHLPEDPPIDSEASGLVETADGATVPWVYEPMMLQREREIGVPLWLWSVAYAVVILAWLILLAFYGWCFVAAAHGGTSRTGTKPQKEAPKP
jgi:hypothetical protein